MSKIHGSLCSDFYDSSELSECYSENESLLNNPFIVLPTLLAKLPMLDFFLDLDDAWVGAWYVCELAPYKFVVAAGAAPLTFEFYSM